ncbi:MAG: hypothetical protein AABX54_05515 [Nanoarchaeota archaeon]
MANLSQGDFDYRWATTDACDELINSLIADIDANPGKYSGKTILFYGNLGSLLYCEVSLRALIRKRGISGLEIKSGNEENGADFSFDVGKHVREYLAKMGLII